MSLAATVLVPTHDHGRTLRYSVGSALAQTVDDLEVFIVGDGVPDVTREVVAELQSADERVRFFDNPKGERHGELHRHAALQEASGRIVCYLADDDLWFPEHVETLARVLHRADFAAAATIRVQPTGGIDRIILDFAHRHFHTLMLNGENRVAFSAAAHTIDLYRALPYGWRTTPPMNYTDLYMWQQILAQDGVRAASTMVPTVALFPTPARLEMTSEEREKELADWWATLEDPQRRQRLMSRIIAHDAKQTAGAEVHTAELRRSLDATRSAYEERVAAMEERAVAGEERVLEVERRAETAEQRAAHLDQQISAVRSSAVWKLRERARGNRLLRRPLSWLARRVTDSPRP